MSAPAPRQLESPPPPPPQSAKPTPLPSSTAPRPSSHPSALSTRASPNKPGTADEKPRTRRTCSLLNQPCPSTLDPVPPPIETLPDTLPPPAAAGRGRGQLPGRSGSENNEAAMTVADERRLALRPQISLPTPLRPPGLSRVGATAAPAPARGNRDSAGDEKKQQEVTEVKEEISLSGLAINVKRGSATSSQRLFKFQSGCLCFYKTDKSDKVSMDWFMSLGSVTSVERGPGGQPGVKVTMKGDTKHQPHGGHCR
ncbi:uncharacterized protein LOC144738047 [Lampetra planeri]